MDKIGAILSMIALSFLIFGYYKTLRKSNKSDWKRFMFYFINLVGIGSVVAFIFCLRYLLIN